MLARWPFALLCVLALAHASLSPAWGQTPPTGQIVGVVCDDNGRPLDFANIVLLGTTMGAMARNGGQFTVNQVPVGRYQVKVSFVGYKQQTRELSVEANRITKISFCGDGSELPDVRTIGKLPEPGTGDLRVVDEQGDAVSSLPLRHTDIRATVVGAAAQVQVEQTFHNPFDRPIESVYVFPLPHKAAVHGMEVRIGERVLCAEIRKRQEAVQVYDTARREGRVAVLLEQERSNIFTQQVANIMPGHDIIVHIRYFEQLTYDAGYELVIPTVVGPRFIPGEPLGTAAVPASVSGAIPLRDEDDETHRARRPGSGWWPDTDHVPDASRITPPVLASGADSGHRIDVAVELDAGHPITRIRSLNHAVDVERDGKTRARVRLRPADTIANKDFVLRFDTVGDRVRFGVLAHRAPDADFGYFTLIAQPTSKPTDYVLPPLDLVLVLDVSGSMQGAPLETEKGVVRWLLQRLRPRDRFSMIQFSDNPRLIARDALLATAENVLAAQRAVETLRAHGGTQMLGAIYMALGLARDPDRRRVICLLTDAYVGNEDTLMRAVQVNLGEGRLFTIGIGSSPNRYLIDGLAREGLGAHDFVSLDEDPRPAVERFFARIESPVLEDIRIDWGRLEVQDVQPGRLPPLFYGHPLQITGRYRRSGHDDIVVRAKQGTEDFEQRLRVRLPGRTAENEALATWWARRRIDDLSRDVRGGDLDAAREIQRLGLQHSLMTRYTAFVATDNQVVNESGAPTLVPQPVEMPQGVRHEGVFGASGQGLHRSVSGMAQTVTVTGQATKVDIKASDVSRVRTDVEMNLPPPPAADNAETRKLPVDEVEEATALNAGTVVKGGELHVRGGRSGPVRIDDASSAGTAPGSITGGVDAPYGDVAAPIPPPTSPATGGPRASGGPRISIQLVAEAVKRSEPVHLRVVVNNNTGRALQVPESLVLANGTCVVSVSIAGVKLRPPSVRVQQSGSTVTLQPGQRREYLIPLNDIDGYVFARPGVYEIRIEQLRGLPRVDLQRVWALTVR